MTWHAINKPQFYQNKKYLEVQKKILLFTWMSGMRCHEKFTMKDFSISSPPSPFHCSLCLLLGSRSSSSSLFFPTKRLLIEHPALSFKLQEAYTVHLKGVKKLKIPGGVWKCPPHCPWLQRLDVLRITPKRPLIDSRHFASVQMLFD